MIFEATEVGFSDGLGGASNSKARADYHYVLFGLQEDNQHPEMNGVYFEYDDQIHGSVNSVERIRIEENLVKFFLICGNTIAIKCNTSILKWDEFLNGIRAVFDENIITNE